MPSNISDIDQAKAIVQQFYGAAQDPALSVLLEDSKSQTKGYRPFFVAAYFIWTEYRQLIKADEATFSYDKKFTVEGLLNMQKMRDCNDETIDPCYKVDVILDELDGDSFSSPSVFVV